LVKRSILDEMVNIYGLVEKPKNLDSKPIEDVGENTFAEKGVNEDEFYSVKRGEQTEGEKLQKIS